MKNFLLKEKDIILYSEINREENKVQIKPNEYTYRGQAFLQDVERICKVYSKKCKEEDRVKAEKKTG